MTIQVKLSAKSQAVTLKNLSREQAHEITRLLTGVDGINRITVEWDEPVNETLQYIQDTTSQPDDDPAKIKYPEQPCAIVAHPETIDHPEPPAATEETLFLLFERPRLSKKDLGPYIDIGTTGIGYHDQPAPDERIVICKGTTKVYTTIGDMERLQFPVNPNELVNLNLSKQAAVRSFKQWVETDYKDHLKQTQGLEDDPDAPYRQQLPPGMIDTGTKGDGGKLDRIDT